MFSFENEIAVTILGSALQQMTLGGYQYNRKPQGVSDLQLLHRRRLYWHGFCLDSDLSTRLGKPPVVNEGQIIDVPDEHPIDGVGVITFNGESFNYLKERVALAKLQYKTYSLLFSDKRAQQPTVELHASIDELDEGLRRWRENVPEILPPKGSLNRSDYSRLICLTVLHYTYLQLTIAVHSVVFVGNCPDETEDRIMSSVALCVSAARASISLLNHHDNPHPFTVFLINHVAWSVDILFMNILHNKSSPRVYEDLALLEKILKFYEKHDANRGSTPAYQITKALYRIASRASRIAQSNTQTHVDRHIVPGAGFQPDTTVSLPGPSHSSDLSDPPQDHMGLPPAMDNMAWAGNGMDHMTSLDPGWMMPMGFQAEYWQDPWANVFQDPDLSDLSLQPEDLSTL
ncbi:Fusaridione A cluster transcription factor fsdR [Lachnellula suecica]|uniref:Fusaridione A cluster transcription factor fsdR n=1 Tax=Lachnellula suecica TaxID=602035 RepID=A0A8T9BZY1_9HELO|nr:Fusaridione A cluster transcription factor fsdR [Lachnellula suecica]